MFKTPREVFKILKIAYFHLPLPRKGHVNHTVNKLSHYILCNFLKVFGVFMGFLIKYE